MPRTPKEDADEAALLAELGAAPVAAEETIIEAVAVVDAEPASPAEVRLHPILTNVEFEAAKAKAAKRYADEQKKAAIAGVEGAELARMKRELGGVTGNPILDEMVSFTVDLAEYADRIVLDGMMYMHGHTYIVSRAKAQTMAEVCYRTREHEDVAIHGRDRKAFYQREQKAHVGARAA